jgi:YggT family protein
MEGVLDGYAGFMTLVRYALFGLAVIAAIVALLDWLVRTRRLNPFGPIGRFCRQVIDPLMLPIERRIVRAGGQPASAPWWTLVAVVVGGLLLVTLLNYLHRLFGEIAWGLSSPGRFGLLVVMWTFGLLRIALIVRVISTWFSMSPYSKWIRWSYVLTEWMLAPVRRVLPTFGPIDISPLVVFFLLGIIQNLIL